MERLQKVIASAGVASRRKAEELILAGKVKVNGEVVRELGTKVSGDDVIMVSGEIISKEDKVYYLLNKPRGVVSTSSDDLNRKTIVDYIDTDKRIYPIGRLDYDTTGLIILTNDGKLANLLMHPTNGVEKTYVAKLNKVITPTDLMILKSGVEVDGIKCIPTRVKLRSKDIEKDKCIVEITIVEGRNHIIKNVFMKLGYLVDKLTRTRYADLTLDNLKSGEYRTLTVKEVKRLYDAAK
ncbi:MAG: rRNA pseudouridine synthase [Bacilli bacterium]|nr:rRNA pseudouridine synthase [Bacilli bacterium]